MEDVNDNKHIIISLGGSLIVPDEIDIEFVKLFIETIKEYVAKGFKFAIITGGGKTARKYQNAIKEIFKPNNNELDWIGIMALRLNAEFLKVSFGELAHDFVINNPQEMTEINKPIIIGGAKKPGSSTDLSAVYFAQQLGARKIINLSNIDFAYNKDPNKFPDAIKIEKNSWSDFRAILPREWDPGLNTPFDPIAAKKAESLGLEVIIMNGKNIENLKHYLNEEPFIGTIIK